MYKHKWKTKGRFKSYLTDDMNNSDDPARISAKRMMNFTPKKSTKKSVLWVDYVCLRQKYAERLLEIAWLKRGIKRGDWRLIKNAKAIELDTEDIIMEIAKLVKILDTENLNRIDLEEDGYKISCYRMIDQIRIDIKKGNPK
jgi:hypothetical protein